MLATVRKDICSSRCIFFQHNMFLVRTQGDGSLLLFSPPNQYVFYAFHMLAVVARFQYEQLLALAAADQDFDFAVPFHHIHRVNNRIDIIAARAAPNVNLAAIH